MPLAASKAISKAAGTFFEYFSVILCCPCLCAIFVCGGVGGKCGGKHVLPTLPDPLPFPTPRIDIQHLPVKEQPQSCYLLSKLPLELRQCIFEQVLGGRLIDLLVVDAASKGWRMVWSRCYVLVDNLAHARTRNIPPATADQLSPALLRSCRQIYAEALPILHQRNTFSFCASHLEMLVRYGLGEYCLPDIRSVYVYELRPSSASGWKDVFVVLHRMGLERVAFELKAEPEMEELDPRIEYSWARRVLKLRNLRRLELWLYYGAGEDPELVERLRGLMIGPGADGRYQMFPEQCRIEAQKI
ncbi:hypothetical protein DFH08DRAFT_903459 [Mycena albidolilacea]|uniref:DUF7730 domain-containing protein n=1 Tax=Mycena albidolilacea TaxID=1033008 RepID=A0AAD6Z251_9AGAR|nr:hypothetical protein DFH08DRAFT_903459 [Mycena albidolilacea]